MLRVLAAELRKAVSQRFVLVLFAVTAAIPLLVGLGLRVADGLSSTPRTTGFACLLAGARYGSIFLALAVLLLGALSVAQERTHGTIVPLLTRPIGRAQVFAGKLLALLVVTIALDVLVACVALAVAAATYGLAPITTEGYEMQSVADMTRHALAAFALSLPALLATASLGFVVGTAAAGVAPAVVAALLAYFPLVVLTLLFKGTTATGFLFTSFTTHFLDVAGDLASGFSTAVFDPRLVMLSLVVPLGTATILTIVAFTIFRRRDVIA
ncbi:MAG: ABC transporter permease [Planctomycetes bacterium]|nr:ABC transporter permease [Planctomycetota bacterium]MBI3844873.1 ABC transporter permease [Planctomycetota bacterium]